MIAKGNFKYFLNGEEVKKENIDMNQAYTTTVSGTSINYFSLDYFKNNRIAEEYNKKYEKQPCGMSTRHKACNSDYNHPGLHSLIDEKKSYDDSSLKLVSKSKKEKALKQDGFKIYTQQVIPDKVDLIPVGVKHNKFKAPLDIVQTRQFPKALQLIALATAFGNKKYEETDKDFLNFKRVPGGSQTYLDAVARHNTERNNIDDDSELHHIIHAAWGFLAALEIWIEEQGIDVKDYSKKYLEKLHNSK